MHSTALVSQPSVHCWTEHWLPLLRILTHSYCSSIFLLRKNTRRLPSSYLTSSIPLVPTFASGSPYCCLPVRSDPTNYNASPSLLLGLILATILSVDQFITMIRAEVEAVPPHPSLLRLALGLMLASIVSIVEAVPPHPSLLRLVLGLMLVCIVSIGDECCTCNVFVFGLFNVCTWIFVVVDVFDYFFQL